MYIIKIDILGQEYDLLMLSEEEFPKLDRLDADGLAELYSKQLIINKNSSKDSDNTLDNLQEYINKVIRHEVVHAYFHEAGLSEYCRDEQLIDWIAIQLPKMANTIKHIEENSKELY